MRSSRPQGSVLVEAALVLSLILVPLLLGVITYGFNLIRVMQASQVNRDAGHMFARGVDFSDGANGLVNQAILTKMAPQIATGSTNGVLILSSVQYFGPNSTYCDKCVNQSHVVITQRIILGNKDLKYSSFGSSAFLTGSLNADGMAKDPTGDLALRADGVSLYLKAMADGDRAYLAETYFSSADLKIPGFPSPDGTSALAFF